MIAVSVVIFVVGAAMGVSVLQSGVATQGSDTDTTAEEPASDTDTTAEKPGPDSDITAEDPAWDLFTTIFANNLLVLLIAFLGSVTLGLSTLFMLLVNGYLFGLHVTHAYENGALFNAFVAIAAHGVFEIPAILLGSAVGFRITWALVQHLRGVTDRVFTAEVRTEAIALTTCSIVLMFVAAVVEATISAQLVTAVT
jgi:uncharacterized membrane protein SpoIIM required for sporulation